MTFDLILAEGPCIPQSDRGNLQSTNLAPRTKQKYLVMYICGSRMKMELILSGISSRFAVLGLSESGDGRLLVAFPADVSKQLEIPLPFAKSTGTRGHPLRYLNVSIYWVGNLIVSIRELIRLRTRKFDLVISEGLQGLLFGRFLKDLRIAKKLVFYKNDIFPLRPEKTLYDWVYNKVYPMLERISLNKSDQTWLLHEYHLGQAERHSALPKKTVRVVRPLYWKRDLYFDKGKDTNPRVCYIGVVREESGLELVVDALSELENHGIKVGLDIIGRPASMPYLQTLLEYTKARHLDGRVTFHGYLEQIEDAHMIMRRCICGLAVFPGGGQNYSNFTIAGKTREYLEVGLPVILSRTSIESKELGEMGCAILVNDSPGEIADGIYRLATDKKLLEDMSIGAAKYASSRSDAAHFIQAIESAVAE